ncbi:MAG: RNA polymerase sigma factor [Bacteroidales bacterium]|nr:MAG: RNA polymerase sigma factor [Bacteroidales bacterium]
MTEVQLDIHKDLIEACKRGNTRAQFKLYQLYSKAMYNICMRMMNTREDAEDMLQDSFTEAFRKLDSFRYEATFGAWLKRIVVNRCINELRRRNSEFITINNIEIYETDDDIFEDTDLDVHRIRQALERLPDGYRVIFSLYFLEGYDHQEISQIMGISESTSKTQLFRAKLKLKEILTQS